MSRRLAPIVAAGLAGLLGAASPPELPQDEGAAFERADSEYGRKDLRGACRDLTAYLLKFPNTARLREARLKRALACLGVSNTPDDRTRAVKELNEVADQGPDDWFKAQALARLVEHGEFRAAAERDARARAALDLLTTLVKARGPSSQEAFERLLTLGVGELQHGAQSDPDAIAQRLLALELTPQQRARVLFAHAQRTLGDPKKAAVAEKELLELGEGTTDFADLALLRLAGVNARRDPARAADLYRRVVAKKGVRAREAQARLSEIEKPILGLEVSYVELPGAKPEAKLTFRNLKEVKLSLVRLDPAAADPKRLLEDGPAKAAPRLQVARAWSVQLKDPGRDVVGTTTVTLEPPPSGVWALEARGGDQLAQALIHVTPYASVLKTSPGEVLVWLVDAMTGQAVGGGSAVAFSEIEVGEQIRYSKVQAGCDGSGLCRMQVPAKATRTSVWVNKNGAWAIAEGSGGGGGDSERERLGYVLTDRPLYKPGEKVGVKIFLRTRGGGPSRPVPGRAFKVVTQSPSGDELDRRTVRTNAFGTVSFVIALKKDAALGDYHVGLEGMDDNDEFDVIQGGGAFAVEEYKPPEFTVSVEALGEPKPGSPVKVRVTASLYAGGPIAFADGRAIVTPSGWSHAFGPWPGEPDDSPDSWGYRSGLGGYGGEEIDDVDVPQRAALGRPGKAPAPGRAKTCFEWAEKVLTFRTGEDGTAELTVEPACAEAPDHALTIHVIVTDLSRREVTGDGLVKLAHERWFADLATDHFLYRPGERIKVRLRAEDANGAPQAPVVQLRLVRVDQQDLPEVLRKDVAITNGLAEAVLDADALGPVRVELRPQGADPKELEPLASADLWLTSEKRPLVPPWDGMFLLTDERPVKAGKMLRALVVAPHAGGHALLTLEGDRVYTAQVVELRGRARFVELPITGIMTPAVTLTASRFERLEVEQEERQLRVFGSEAPIDVRVKAAASTTPGSALPVDIQLAGAPAGTPVEVAFTVVDQAIFAIAPEARDFATFFARPWSGDHVETEFSTSYLQFRPLPPEPAPTQPAVDLPRPDWLDASRGAALAGLRGSSRAKAAGILGVASKADFDDLAGAGAGPGEAKKKRDGPASPSAEKVAPPPSSEASPKPVPVPVRVRSRFSSSGGWFPALPGSLGGAAQAQARFSDSLTSWKLTAYAVSPNGHLGVGSATVRTEQPLMVRLQGPRFFTERDEVVISAVITSRLPKPVTVEVAFEVPGLKSLEPANRRVTVGPGGDARVDVRYAVVGTGNQRVRATVRAAGAADAMEWTLPSVVHGVVKRTAFTGQLKEKVAFEVTLPQSRNPSGTQLSLIASPSLLGAMLDALPYLAEYPYGCVEQTLSRFVPAVAAARAVNKLGLSNARVPKDLDQMVDAGLKRLYGFEHGDGGWGWWETDATDPRMTAYVVYGLSLAKEAGVKVDPKVVERGRGWLFAAIEKKFDSDDLAFASFALAASGPAPKKALDLAFAARGDMSDRGKAFTALALATAKDPRAKEALDGLAPLFEVVRLGLQGGRVADVWDGCAGVETVALTLMAASRRDPNDPRVRDLTDFLVLRRKGAVWSTTRDTAFAVYALGDEAIRARGKAADGSIKVLVNGKLAAQIAYKSGGAEIKPITIADAAFKVGANQVEIQHQGSESGHWAALFDIFDVDENVKAHGNPAVEVERSYTVLGRPGGEKPGAVMEYGMPVESGERVRVDLTLKVAKPLEYVIIEDKKPAGLEPVLQRSGPEVCGNQCTHAELRTDRVAMFARSLAPGVHHFSYELRAEVPGRFHGLPAQVEAMYSPEVRASSDEMRVEVRDAPKPAEGVSDKH
jgi:hypothetical protein